MLQGTPAQNLYICRASPGTGAWRWRMWIRGKTIGPAPSTGISFRWHVAPTLLLPCFWCVAFLSSSGSGFLGFHPGYWSAVSDWSYCCGLIYSWMYCSAGGRYYPLWFYEVSWARPCSRHRWQKKWHISVWIRFWTAWASWKLYGLCCWFPEKAHRKLNCSSSCSIPSNSCWSLPLSPVNCLARVSQLISAPHSGGF